MKTYHIQDVAKAIEGHLPLLDLSQKLRAFHAANRLLEPLGLYGDTLHEPESALVRLCVAKPGADEWLGVLTIDHDGRVYADGCLPKDEIGQARYAVFQMELALRAARATEDTARRRAAHGEMPLWAFLTGILHAAVYGGAGWPGPEEFIRQHKDVVLT